MVPFVDLKKQHAALREDLVAAVARVIDSTQFVLGNEVAAFEEEFSAYSGTAHGIAVNTGTSALHLAMLAAGVGPGDEVITVPMTFVATAAAIGYAGATPVFVDVDRSTYTMDPSRIEAAITPRTKAIVPVHLYGQPADMDPILEIGRRYGLTVIEDAAQAHGAEYKGRRCGSIGALGCFSFYPGKNLGACGEGGMVTTNNPEYVRDIRMRRDWGAEKKYHHVMKGFNYRMEGIQGAILRVKLRHLETWTEARRHSAALYRAALGNSGLVLPVEASDRRHVFHVYAVLAEHRQDLMNALGQSGIQCGIHYPIPVHLQPAYAELGYQAGDFPVAERVAEQQLSLPMCPELTAKQIAHVGEAVAAFTEPFCYA